MSDQPGPVQDNVSIEQEPPDREQDEFEGDAASSEELADWGGGELEAAYLKALSALEASESEMPVELSETSSQSRSSEDEEGTVVEHLTLSTLAHVAKALSGGSSTASATLPPPPRDQRARPRDERVPSPPTANSATKEADAFPAKEIRPTPRQIIEACLFVGGSALTSKRLSGVLRGEFDVEFVDREVDELNRLYAAEPALHAGDRYRFTVNSTTG